jgi:hypothetical protein
MKTPKNLPVPPLKIRKVIDDDLRDIDTFWNTKQPDLDNQSLGQIWFYGGRKERKNVLDFIQGLHDLIRGKKQKVFRFSNTPKPKQ